MYKGGLCVRIILEGYENATVDYSWSTLALSRDWSTFHASFCSTSNEGYNGHITVSIQQGPLPEALQVDPVRRRGYVGGSILLDNVS